MRTQQHPIALSQEERRDLTVIASSGRGQARIMRRAQMLLWSAEGKSDLEIAALLDVRPNTVAKTRARWVKGQGLADQPRSGRHPKTDGKQDAFLVALACSEVPEGQSQWTMQLLAQHWVELGVVEGSISDETVRRRLKKTISSRG